jgi:hypothetical protein
MSFWSKLLLILIAYGVSERAAHPQAGQYKPVYALVVGDSDYGPTGSLLQNLPAVSAGADSIVKSLTTMKAVVYGGKAFHDLNHDDLKTTIAQFRASLPQDATAVVYYGGHGFQSNGQNYIVPSVADLSAVQDLILDGLSLEADVVDPISNGRMGSTIVFVDACRDNPFDQSLHGLRQFSAAPSNTLVVYAAAPNATTAAASPFADVVSKDLLIIGSPIEQIISSINSDVLAATQNHQQIQSYGAILPPPVLLRAPAYLDVKITSADDVVEVFINGTDVASSTKNFNSSVRVSLPSGNTTIEVRVFNQKSYTGGIQGLGGHLPEGWNYEVQFHSDSYGSSFNSVYKDSEDRPAIDGPHFGATFTAARGTLSVDPNTGVVNEASKDEHAAMHP